MASSWLVGRYAVTRFYVPRDTLRLTESQLRVNTVHEKGSARYTQQDTLDEAGGESFRFMLE